MKMKILNFLSTLFGNKNFISQESSIFADFKNIDFQFQDIIDFKKFTLLLTLLEKMNISSFLMKPGGNHENCIIHVFNGASITLYYTFGSTSRFLLSSFQPV